MNGLELLKEYPKAALVVRQWFLDRMLESLKDESLPEDFKEIVRKEGIDDERVAGFIDLSPRTLFDVFDDHKLPLQIVYENTLFRWNLCDLKSSQGWKTRKEADFDGVQAAFKLLNDKL